MAFDSDVVTPTLIADGSSVSDPDPDDSDYGWVLFVGFITAALAITLVICVLAMVASWWMLGVAVAVDLGITAMMTGVIYGAFRSPSYSDLEPIEAASKAALAQQVIDRKAPAGSLVAH